MPKRCCRCRRSKPASEFYRRSDAPGKRHAACKACFKRAVRANRRANHAHYLAYDRERRKTMARLAAQRRYQKRYRDRHPDRVRARARVAAEVRAGRLRPGPCAVCGKKRTQAHHPDYAKPLEVVWLCFRCHRVEGHGQRVAQNRNRSR